MRSLPALTLLLGVAFASPTLHAGRAAAASPATPPSPAAKDKDSARRLFAEGTELEQQGKFTDALARYQEAAKVAETAGLRFHIGYCLEMNGQLAEALHAYEAADVLARDTGKPEVHAAVAQRLEALRLRVAHVELRVAPLARGMVVELDGVPQQVKDNTGLAIAVNPGLHTITARAEGYKPYSRTERISEGQTKPIDIALVPVAAATAPAAPVLVEPPAQPSPMRSYTGPILATTGTVLLAGAGLATFLMAGAAADDARTTCPQKASCDDERQTVRTLDTIALAGFSTAAVLGVVSIVLWTRTGGDASREASALSTRLVASPTSIGITGAF